MPVTVITTKATFQLKVGAGYIRQIYVSNPGTSWTLQLNDGPVGATNNVNSMIGATPVAIPASNAGAAGLLPNQVYFPNGIQVVTGGTTAGELAVDWF